jgi:hypothetical protein
MASKTRKAQYKVASFLRDLADPEQTLEKLLKLAIRRKKFGSSANSVGFESSQ